jgi:hypothetical protein
MSPVDRKLMHAQVDTIANNLQQLVELAQNDPKNAGQINPLIKQLKENVDGLNIEVSALSKATSNLKELSNNQQLQESDLDAALKVLDITGDAASDDLDNFLSKVGASLVNAQRSLNDQSKSYSDAVVAQFNGLIPPAQFAIPKVTAEMTIGVNEVKDKTINLIFFRDSVTKSNFAQSKISFDLVAAPPPPGAALNLTPFLVLQGRQEFLAEVEKDPIVVGTLGQAKFRSLKRFGVIFALPPASTSNNPDVYMVVYVLQDPAKSILDPDWSNIVLVAVQRVNGKLQLYNKLWEASDTNPLSFPKTKNVQVTSLGDVLMQVVSSVYKWMESLGLPLEAS